MKNQYNVQNLDVWREGPLNTIHVKFRKNNKNRKFSVHNPDSYLDPKRLFIKKFIDKVKNIN